MDTGYTDYISFFCGLQQEHLMNLFAVLSVYLINIYRESITLWTATKSKDFLLSVTIKKQDLYLFCKIYYMYLL